MHAGLHFDPVYVHSAKYTNIVTLASIAVVQSTLSEQCYVFH